MVAEQSPEITSTTVAPVRVSIDAPEIVLLGLRSLLAGFDGHVELGSERSQCDVELFVRASRETPPATCRDLPRLELVPESVPGGALRAARQGAAHVLTLGVSAEELVRTLEQVRSEPVADDGLVRRHALRLAAEMGISPREGEILSRICQGVSNDEIARELFLSINSVKTYIRSLYRKIGVMSRSQAVVWGLERGF